jgi:hypothetical protein
VRYTPTYGPSRGKEGPSYLPYSNTLRRRSCSMTIFGCALGIYAHYSLSWSSPITRVHPPHRLHVTNTYHTQILSYFDPDLPSQLPNGHLLDIFQPCTTPRQSYQMDIFWTSFSLALLPDKASLIYNSPKILEWWRAYPAVLKKGCGTEALDRAS